MEEKSLYAMTPQSLVHGWKDIGKIFGVSHVIVKRWAADGAPVVMVTAEMPCVAVGELWGWLKTRQQGKGSALAGKEFIPCRETHRNAAPMHESGKHESTTRARQRKQSGGRGMPLLRQCWNPQPERERLPLRVLPSTL